MQHTPDGHWEPVKSHAAVMASRRAPWPQNSSLPSRVCVCATVLVVRIFSWQGLGNEQQMCVGHLVSVEEAPSVMRLGLKSRLGGRTRRTDRNPQPAYTVLSVVPPHGAPRGIHMGADSCLALNAQGVKVSVCCDYTQPLIW